jgi:hypothetical protein
MRGLWRCGALAQMLLQLPSRSGAWLALWPGSGGSCGSPGSPGSGGGSRGAAQPWPAGGGPSASVSAGGARAEAGFAGSDVPRVLFERIGTPVSECKRAVAEGLGRDLLDSAQVAGDASLSASQQCARRRALEGAALALANCHIGELGAAGGLATWQPYANAADMGEAHFSIFTQFLLAAERALGELEHERRQRGVEEMLAALYGEAAATREAVRNTSGLAGKGAELASIAVRLQRRSRAEARQTARALQQDLRTLRRNATDIGASVHGAAGAALTLATLLAEQRSVLDGVLRDSRELREAVERGRADFADTLNVWGPALNAVRVVTENRADWLRPVRTAAAYLAWAAGIWIIGPALAGSMATVPLFACLAAEAIVPDAAWHWAGLDAIAHKRDSEEGAKEMRNAGIMLSLAAAIINMLRAHLPSTSAIAQTARTVAASTIHSWAGQDTGNDANHDHDTVAALVDAIVQIRIANPQLRVPIPHALLRIITLAPPGYKVRLDGDEQGELQSDDI